MSGLQSVRFATRSLAGNRGFTVTAVLLATAALLAAAAAAMVLPARRALRVDALRALREESS